MSNLFESSAKPVLQSAISTMEERGSQYSDTLASCQWHITLAVAKELGIRITDRQARALAIAGLCDIKYERFAGGYKMDHIEDGINYLAVLPNMVEVAREEPSLHGPKLSYVPPNVVPFKDATFETVDDCKCYECSERRIVESELKESARGKLIKWHQWSNRDLTGFVAHKLVYSIKFDEKERCFVLRNFRPLCSDFALFFLSCTDAKGAAEDIEKAGK